MATKLKWTSDNLTVVSGHCAIKFKSKGMYDRRYVFSIYEIQDSGIFRLSLCRDYRETLNEDCDSKEAAKDKAELWIAGMLSTDLGSSFEIINLKVAY